MARGGVSRGGACLTPVAKSPVSKLTEKWPKAILPEPNCQQMEGGFAWLAMMPLLDLEVVLLP